MFAYRILRGILVCLLASCPAFLTGCADVGATFNVLTFQKADHSGVTGTQNFTVYLITNQPGRSRLDLPQRLQSTTDVDLNNVLRGCTTPAGQLQTALAPLAATVLSKAGQVMFDAAFSQIEAKAKQLKAQSTKEYTASVSWPARKGGEWSAVRCIVLERVVTPDPNTKMPERGLLAVIANVALDEAALLTPLYVRLENAWAITGNSGRPAVQLDIVFAMRGVVANKVEQLAEIKLPPLTAAVGSETPVCTVSPPIVSQDCPHHSNIFPLPKPGTKTFELTVKVVETGSGAPDEERVKAGDKALKEITKPVLDDVLGKLVMEASSAPAKKK